MQREVSENRGMVLTLEADLEAGVRSAEAWECGRVIERYF